MSDFEIKGLRGFPEKRVTFMCNGFKQKCIYIILLLALFLSVTGNANTSLLDHTKATVTSNVIEVYDGDTIRLANGMEVRYLNLDTPETHHPEKPVEYFGVKASKFNQQLVGDKKVKLEYDVQKKDQYGRVLAYVYVKQDGEWINVNAELLKEGYARVYTIPPNVKYADYFLELEKEARKNCRGLWQSYCEDPPVFSATEIEDKMDEYLGEVVTVKYKVTGTYDSGDIIFLNSSSNYDIDFTAVIFKDDEKYFIKRGIESVRDYDGKTIEVTGELQEYDGPEIILYHPYQVEVVD